MTEQTQTLLFSADHFLTLFSIFSVLQEDIKEHQIRQVLLCISLWNLGVDVLKLCYFNTCVESRPSRPSGSMHSSFSLFLMSGRAALMSILRLEVGVQGSTEPTSLPFLGVVRGPMADCCWLSADNTQGPVNFSGVFPGTWGATKPPS